GLEQRNLALASSSLHPSADHVAELADDVVLRDAPFLDCDHDISGLAECSRPAVDHEACLRDELRRQLPVLGARRRADGVDVRALSNPIVEYDWLARGRQ